MVKMKISVFLKSKYIEANGLCLAEEVQDKLVSFLFSS